MARSAEDEFADMPGQDSFLDVLTNMVGIIILLVVVTALRTSQATIKAAVDEKRALLQSQAAAPQRELDDAARKARLAEENLKNLMGQVVGVRGEAELREKERNYMTAYVAAFEQELDERRSTLSDEKQRDFDLRRKLAESQLALENLGREQIALLSAPAEVEAIENEPTPLAEHAAGNRVYMYLSGGRVATVPKELFDATTDDLKENVWRLNNESHFTRTVGPVGGFRLRYLVALQAVRLGGPEAVGVGAQRAQVMARPQLVWFKITPATTPLGESVEEAIQPNSDFRQTLRENPADTSVVVIAVYPDSIHELHQLKKELYTARYATAYVPFKQGQPMKGVPTGSSQQSRSGEVFAQ